MVESENTYCDYGCGNKAKHIFKNGKHCCSETTSSCPEMKKRNGKAVSKTRENLGNSFWKNGHPKGMKNKKHRFSGQSYEQIYGKEEAIKKKNYLRNNVKLQTKNSWSNLSQIRKDEIKKENRERINKRYENGWLPKAGRCKKYTYNSHIAGNVSLDGTWELMVAKWLDKNNIKWTRNTTRFKYVHLNGRDSYYIPDFWIEDWNSYLEVKGYETDLDRCKWNQFGHNLIIWKKKDIEKIMEDGQDGNAADC